MSEYFSMPEGYRCPLCPDHDDDKFCWDPLLSSPICQGCSHEIINLVCDEKRIDDSALDRLEAVTGLTYEELQVAVLGPEIRRMAMSLEPEELLKVDKRRGQLTAEEWIEGRRQDLARYRRLVALAKARMRAKERPAARQSEPSSQIIRLKDFKDHAGGTTVRTKGERAE